MSKNKIDTTTSLAARLRGSAKTLSIFERVLNDIPPTAVCDKCGKELELREVNTHICVKDQ